MSGIKIRPRLAESQAPARLRPGPLLLLGLLMAAAALTLWETRGQNLYADELGIFTSYRSWSPGELLRPDGGHLVVTSLIAYKALFAIFGADSYLPIRVLHVLLGSVCAGLLYALARKRIGDYWALAPTALLLVLGSASEVTATPLGALAYMGIGFGLAALLAAESQTWRGDLVACLCLIGGLASYSIAIAFTVGVAVLILQRGPGARRRTAWVVWVPVALYGIYRLYALHYGGTESNVSLANVGSLPTAMFTELAAATSGLAGLFRVPAQQGFSFDATWGYPLGAVLVGLVVLRLLRPPPVNPRLWALVAALVSFWALVALNLGPLRTPESSRYAYIAGMLLLLVVIELLADWRPTGLAVVALGAAFAASLVANVVALHEVAPQYRIAGRLLSADLAAVEIARDRVDPELPVLSLPDLPVVRDLQIPSRDYLAAVDQFGSPAFSLTELSRASETPRAAADAQLVRLLGIHTEPLPALDLAPGAPAPAIEGVAGGPARTAGNCVVFSPASGAAGSIVLRLPPGGLIVLATPGPPVSIALRRFADGFASGSLRSLGGGSTARFAIPTDAAPVPWHAQIGAAQRIEACPNPAR